MEISRVTKFFIDRGATVTAELTSGYYRRSPLIQGKITQNHAKSPLKFLEQS